MRQPDGSFGEGPAKAFATGGAAAAILRMGLPLEKREAVIAAIKAGQRPDGAWSKDDGPSDLSSSYRVMRCLYMLKEKPDAAKLRRLHRRCRQADGSYSITPGGREASARPTSPRSSSAGSACSTASRRSSRPPPSRRSSTARTWPAGRGTPSLWSARDGMLVGKSPGLDHNEFLATRQGYRDFILSLRFRLEDGKGNSGVQFRSVRVPGTEMSGYQADIGENYWGCLYDESRRNKVLVKASAAALESLKKDGWNHYVLCAMGDRITLVPEWCAVGRLPRGRSGDRPRRADRGADPRGGADGGPVQGPPDPAAAVILKPRLQEYVIR